MQLLKRRDGSLEKIARCCGNCNSMWPKNIMRYVDPTPSLSGGLELGLSGVIAQPGC